LLFQVCRTKPKGFLQRRPNGGDTWIWNMQGARRVLYKLPALYRAITHNMPVHIVEGEKDADNLIKLGLAATTNPGGAGKWQSSYNEFLRGADVILIPDNDDAGRGHMQQVAGELQGVAKSIRILTLPALPDKGDVSDWLARGGDAEQLRTLIDAAPHHQRTRSLTLRRHRDVNNPTRTELVKGLFPETGTGLLSGQSGTYKTFVALHLAGAIASGRPIAGYPVKRPGAVIAFVSEGASGWPQRLDALSKHEYDNARLPIFYVGDPICLLDPKSVADVIDVVKEAAGEAKRDYDLPLSLVLFDTIIGSAGFAKAGDENDAVVNAKLMNALAQISSETGTFVLGIDHFGKAVETGTRGSSAKEAAADVVLALLANKSPSGGITEQRLAVRKRRDGPAGIEHSFAIESVDLGEDEDGDIIKSCAVVFSSTASLPIPKEIDGWTKSLQTLKRILMTLLADCGQEVLTHADSPATTRALKADILRQEYYKQHPANDQPTKQKAFIRALKAAQDRNLIGLRDISGTQFVWLIAKATP
jgi:AAA domain